MRNQTLYDPNHRCMPVWRLNQSNRITQLYAENIKPSDFVAATLEIHVAKLCVISLTEWLKQNLNLAAGVDIAKYAYLHMPIGAQEYIMIIFP